jgi:hypothetical protein
MEEKAASRLLEGNREEKMPLGRHRRRWEDKIKMDLQERGRDNTDWIRPARNKGQGAGSCEHANKPSSSLKFGVFLD